jgi:chromate transporter
MTDESGISAPSPLRLFLVFARISLTSFGGGLSGWLLRELVSERGWIGEDEFLDGLAVSQALPGVNVANLSIWIGYRLFGVAGVLAALAGMIVPGGIAIILIASCFETIDRLATATAMLTGAGAAAIALSLSMGIAVARRVPRRTGSLLVMAASFAGVALLHWPIVWTVLGLGAVSVILSFRARAGSDR